MLGSATKDVDVRESLAGVGALFFPPYLSTVNSPRGESARTDELAGIHKQLEALIHAEDAPFVNDLAQVGPGH